MAEMVRALIAPLAGWLLVGALVFASALAAEAPPSLRVYGPGGPLAPMQACAEEFSRQRGVPVEVVGGPEKMWIARAKEAADVFYGGADYMLAQFAQNHPELVELSTRTELYRRAAGILVRPGNPRGIRSLRDLARPGIRSIEVLGAGQIGLWEDGAGRVDLIGPIRRNIVATVATSAEAVDLWKKRPEIDAWVTFESWHHRLREVSDVVRLPENERLYRGTPVVIARHSRQPALAAEFVAFLQSDAAHAVFRRHGWE